MLGMPPPPLPPTPPPKCTQVVCKCRALISSRFVEWWAPRVTSGHTLNCLSISLSLSLSLCVCVFHTASTIQIGTWSVRPLSHYGDASFVLIPQPACDGRTLLATSERRTARDRGVGNVPPSHLIMILKSNRGRSRWRQDLSSSPSLPSRTETSMNQLHPPTKNKGLYYVQWNFAAKAGIPLKYHFW